MAGVANRAWVLKVFCCVADILFKIIQNNLHLFMDPLKGLFNWFYAKYIHIPDKYIGIYQEDE